MLLVAQPKSRDYSGLRLVSVQLALDCQLELSLAKFHLGEGDLFRQRAASIYGLVCSFDLSRGSVTEKNFVL